MTGQKATRRPREIQALWIIITLAVLARVGAALYAGNEVVPLPGTYDQVSYHKLALRLLDGHGFSFGEPWWPLTAAGAPTAHWSFLYTAYLYVVYSLFGPNPLVARLLQAVAVGILHPYLAYRLARHIFDTRVGLIAAALTAGYIYFVYYAATLMTEPFYITAILASMVLALRLADAPEKGQWTGAAALGMALGTAVLLRQLFLLMVPVIILWLVWIRRRWKRQLPLGVIGAVVAIIVIMIVPFTIYNYGRFEGFVLLNTNAGYAFFWANHPIYGTHFESILPPEIGDYQDLIPAELRHLDEAALDQALLRRGVGFVLEDPGRYVLLSLSRIPAYFKFWPSPESSLISNVSRVLSSGILWPLMVAGILLAAWRVRREDVHGDGLLLLLLFVAVYTAIHLLSWALIRYRLPVDAVLLVPAALPAVEVLRWLHRWLPAGPYETLLEH